VYYVYVDEAGTSAPEPVTVVVGVIIHADRDWRRVERRLASILDQYVPASRRSGFTFHAKAIWGNPKCRDGWPVEDRIALIGAVAAIARNLGLAISLGRVRRDAQAPPPPPATHDFHHFLAFSFCMIRADKYVRDWSGPEEVATVVAEDVPKKRHFLRRAVEWGRAIEITPAAPEYIRLTAEEQRKGVILQTGSGKIDRIIDTVHFTEKAHAPLLQVADACAFVFRRYFSQQEYGEHWLKEMLGAPLEWKDWQGPASNITFSFNPSHQYPGRSLRPAADGGGALV
jgi:hypothetical protein